MYEKIVYWRKNILMVASRKGGKKFINKTTKLVNLWTKNSPLENIALKGIHVVSALFLHENKNSKAKDHVAALERRLELQKNGNITELFNEEKSVQERLPTGEKSKDITNGALKLLTNKMSNGILHLSEVTFLNLKMKHPDKRDASDDII